MRLVMLLGQGNVQRDGTPLIIPSRRAQCLRVDLVFLHSSSQPLSIPLLQRRHTRHLLGERMMP